MKILYFSQVPWSWIRQRPHLLPEALAKLGHEVTFFSIATEKKTTNFRKDNFNVREIHGMRGSAKYSLSRLINRFLCKGALSAAQYDAVILTYPFQLEFLPDSLKQGQLLYDCMDLVPDFYEGKTKSFMESRERELCAKTTGIIASSSWIIDQLRSRYGIDERRITLIRNAVSPDSLVNENGNEIALNTRNAVYIGTIDWWIDFDVIYQFCRDNSDFFIYMVGPVCRGAEDKVAEAPPNVIFTGPLEHGAALDYVKRAKIALIPFVVTDLIKGVDPVKLYEYLALGKPVVSAYWRELEHFGHEGIFYYVDAASFAEAITDAAGSTAGERIDFVMENSWNDRAHKLESAICQIGK